MTSSEQDMKKSRLNNRMGDEASRSRAHNVCGSETHCARCARLHLPRQRKSSAGYSAKISTGALLPRTLTLPMDSIR